MPSECGYPARRINNHKAKQATMNGFYLIITSTLIVLIVAIWTMLLRIEMASLVWSFGQGLVCMYDICINVYMHNRNTFEMSFNCRRCITSFSFITYWFYFSFLFFLSICCHIFKWPDHIPIVTTMMRIHFDILLRVPHKWFDIIESHLKNKQWKWKQFPSLNPPYRIRVNAIYFILWSS